MASETQTVRKKILITGNLEQALTDKLAVFHDVDVVPFIKIEPVTGDNIEEELKSLSKKKLHVVFTSNNGVQAVADIIGARPEQWQMFSIEGVTSRSVSAHFGENSLAATAYSGADLAWEILKAGDVEEVVFFCGDLRRDELPERLKARGVKVREVVVYHTEATPAKLEMEYDAIAFFSPSAVYSVVSMNIIEPHAVCFAIGKTTANTIKNIVPNKVIIAQPPQKEVVVDMLIEYYKGN